MCRHLVQYATADPAPNTPEGCEDCLKIGAGWVHLRVCQVWRVVGCCDSSPNKHASRHYAETGHPVMRSYQPGENWRWCFRDELDWEPA